MQLHPPENIRNFFVRASWLDYLVLRPLSHIASNWEIQWDQEKRRYKPERSSFAEDLNIIIEIIATHSRPVKYHSHEDAIAERLIQRNWPIQKRGQRWIGADYQFILEQGAFEDFDQQDLIAAATGRVHAALDYGQSHFDNMEEGHLHILSGVLSIIIYHRYCDRRSALVEE